MAHLHQSDSETSDMMRNLLLSLLHSSLILPFLAVGSAAQAPVATEDAQAVRSGESPKELWHHDLKSPSYGSGTLGDIDGDGKLEIVFGTYFNDEHLYALNAEDGSVLWKHKSERGPFDASVAIVDLDGDNKLDILAGDSSTGTLFCLDGKGQEKWTIKLPNSTDSPPAVADLDGDGVLEIVVGSMWKKNRMGDVSVYRADNRQLVWRREVPGCVQSAACLVDLNGDEVLDVIVASWRGDNAVHAFSGKDGKDLWTFETMGEGDTQKNHLGLYHGVSAAPLVKDGPLRIAFGTCSTKNGTLFVLDAKGKLVWKKMLGEYLFAPTAIEDLDGDGQREIIVCGSNTYAWTASGKLLWKAPVRSIRGAAIADIDNDGDLDLVLGAYPRRAVALDGPTGKILWSFDATFGKHRAEKVDSAPLIADFDGDGNLDVFFVGGKGWGNASKPENYGRAFALSLGKGSGVWGTFRGNLRRTGSPMQQDAGPKIPGRMAAAAARPHPRLFMDAARAEQVKKKIAADPLLGKAMAYVRASADAILVSKPVVRKKKGRRLLNVSRTCLKRVTYLAFVYRMRGEARYLERAKKEMLAAADFKDWNPSHFLDVAEMTAALAIGYDWLYEDLSPETRRVIRKAIVEKGLKTSMRGGWWVRTTNNWNQVCHGGLSLGALAVLEDERELATRIIERALLNLPRAMKEYGPDGAYPEGPGYWRYGTSYNVLLIDALQSVLGTDFGLAKAKGFLESSDYEQQVCGPTGLFFNYSDCGARAGVSPAMYWFAAHRHQPSLLWRQKTALLRGLAAARPDASGAGRTFPFLLIWAGPLTDVRPPLRMHWKADGRTPVGMHRSTWGPEATYVAIKGGSPRTNHAHMDVGSFVMDSEGVRWACDLGAQSYQSLESKGIDLWNMGQKSERWTVFRLNNFSHNTLVVDGKKQRVGGRAAIVSFAGTALERRRAPHTIVDLTSVYRGQLARARRGVALLRDLSVLVQDEVETLDHGTTLRWGMVTRAKVERIQGGVALLSRSGKKLTLRVLSPSGVKLEIYNTAKPLAAHDQPNPGTRMIGFQVRLPASSTARLMVQLIPGSSKPEPHELQALSDW